MIKAIAAKFERWAKNVGPLTFDDLIQEGIIGALNAVRLYDPDRGIKFVTYSYLAIQNQIVRSIQLSDWVGIKSRKAGNKHRIISFNQKISSDDDKELVLMFAAKPESESPEYSMQELMALIPDDRSREVIRLRYVEDWTLEEVGKRIGVTKERIRQIELNALKSIRMGITLNERFPARRLTEDPSGVV